MSTLAGCSSPPELEPRAGDDPGAPNHELGSIQPSAPIGAPTAWFGDVQAAIAASEYRFRRSPSGDAFEGRNRAQDLRADFAHGAVRIGSRGRAGLGEITLALKRMGRKGAWSLPAPAQPRLGACSTGSRADERGECLRRLEYEHGRAVEWWENREEGLEQGFTLGRRPGGQGPLELWIEVKGARVEVRDGDREAVFIGKGGLRVRYGALVVKDAEGRELEAWLADRAAGLAIVVRDDGARYPIVVDPLLTAAAWSGQGDQQQALYGSCVASAGDVNGDGFSDVLVGAPDHASGTDNAGRAYLYLGSASGPEAIPAWTVEGDQANGQLGFSLASAGDVNGDGFSDVIVGAPGESNGQNMEGRVYLYFGSESGLAAISAWTAEGDQALANLGRSVATAGDVNGDGFSDVVIGAYRYDNGQADEGRAYVYLGSAGGLGVSPLWTAESNQAGAFFARAVATAGDVNADGFSDVLVGAYGFDDGQNDEGRAYLYLGAPLGLAASPAWTADGNQAGAFLGRSLASAGDVNADGFADVIVGAPSHTNGQTAEGRAYVYLGSATGLANSAASTLEGNQAGASYATSVAGAGDVNGDGYADVVVGSLTRDVQVYRGSSSGLLLQPAWTLAGDQPGASFGVSAAGAGDVNGDGLSDILVGAPGYDGGQSDEGAAFFYRGATSGLGSSASFTAESNQVAASFGESVAAAGDVNGDGYADVLVGAAFYDGAVADAGRVFAYLGSPAGLSAIAAWTAESDQAFSLFGASLASAGDVNGDGYADVIIGAPRYQHGETAEGRAFLYLGSATGLELNAAWMGEGDQANAVLGVSVAGAGDINGDGFSDVVIGAPGYQNGDPLEGRAYVYLGSTSGLAETPIWTGESNQPQAQFGGAVASAGDVNGDGFSDVVIGAPSFDGEGSAFVHHGSAGGLSMGPVWSASGDQAGAQFAASVDGAGDVNGDGYADVVIGAPGFDTTDVDQGRAYVYLGSAAGLRTSSAWNAGSAQVIAQFGRSVAGGGDVNGDGYADVVVGAPSYANGQAGEGFALVYLGSPSGPAGAPWLGESNQVDAHFGTSVSGAGDVNGDGYSDVIVGAPQYDNGQANEGRAFLFLGNGGDGTSAGSHPAVQARVQATATPIAPMGRASGNAFDVRAMGRTPFGRGRVGLMVEVKQRGAPFDGRGIVFAGGWTDSGVSGAELVESITDLAFDSDYHWRARVAYDPALGWAHGASRWLYGGALGEPRGVHVRTPCSDDDGDGICDLADGCPLDPAKVVPGACGCAVPDTDTDGDAVPDCLDACPTAIGTGNDGCPEGSGGVGGTNASGGAGAGGTGGGAGTSSSGGAGPAGGTANAGGVAGAGGLRSSGGSGGAGTEPDPSGSGGAAGEEQPGQTGSSGAAGSSSDEPAENSAGFGEDDGGCGCRVPLTTPQGGKLWAVIVFAYAFFCRRRSSASKRKPEACRSIARAAITRANTSDRGSRPAPRTALACRDFASRSASA